LVAKIVMPRLSLTMKTGTVIQWFKQEGESIAEVLSEKVTYEVEAPESGVLRKILVDEGVESPVNATLGLIALPEENLDTEKVETELVITEPLKETITPKPKFPSLDSPKEHVLASPAAKREAKEHNVQLEQIRGTGPDGRILEKDVKRYLEERKTSVKIKKELPLTGIRKTTAERVTKSFRKAPHSYVIMEVDMTNAAKIRNEVDASYTAMLVYSTAKALREFPEVNSTLFNEKIRVYEDINIGIAVTTERGLVVPVLKKADENTLEITSSKLKALVEDVRGGKLEKEKLTGSTFTVTNLGMYNVDMFLPIINPPEAAILAAGRIIERPIVENGEIRIKPTMILTLGYDHRIIDGSPAAKLLNEIKENLEHII
jgi:pyruvate dehydrogenase E2 component (dihydrolipoamide acetyltransferase)